MHPTDTLAILLSVLLPGGWLVYKLNGFAWISKINDPKGILIPSLLFLLSPFFTEWIVSTRNFTDFPEIAKPLLPLLTFILGQNIAKRDKVKEREEQQSKIALMLIFKIEMALFEALSFVEREIMSAIRAGTDAVLEESKTDFRKHNSKVESIYTELSSQLDLVKSDNGRSCLLYVKKVSDFLESTIGSSLCMRDKINLLTQARVLKIQGYASIMSAAENLSSSTGLLCDQLKIGCTLKLNQEKLRLLDFKNDREKKIEFWKNKTEIDRARYPDINQYFQYDMDAESYPVNVIKNILSSSQKK
jgi:hypothetical protein